MALAGKKTPMAKLLHLGRAAKPGEITHSHLHDSAKDINIDTSIWSRQPREYGYSTGACLTSSFSAAQTT